MGNIQSDRCVEIDKIVLDLGVIPDSEFEAQFNQRLAKAFAQYLLQQGENDTQEPVWRQSVNDTQEPVWRRSVNDTMEQKWQQSENDMNEWGARQSGNSTANLSVQLGKRELYPFAVSCLQQVGQQTEFARFGREQSLFLRQLLASAGRFTVPAVFFHRVTLSRLAVAAIHYLLNNAQGLQFLSNNYPSLSQLTLWEKAIADGEITPELVVQLMLCSLSVQQSEVARRWLLPLWQKKAVRHVVRHHVSKAAAADIDACFRKLLQQSVQQQSQNIQIQRQYTDQVTNAGMVLLWPLLPQLFSLQSFCQDGTFISDAAREQAARSLDWLVWADAEEPPFVERLLVNRLLCGVAADTPTPERITMPQRQLIDDWLTAICQQLPGRQKLSINDIRGLFLQRPGGIDSETLPTQIKVQPEPFDYLLRDWPWPLTMASFPWLDQPLTIVWPVNGLAG